MGNSLRSVGIILVNYNGSDDTVECVNSLLLQTYKNFHIYIIDNGSSETEVLKLKNLAKAHKKIKLVLLNSNYGFPKAVNEGIKNVLTDGCDYIWSLNNDTVVSIDAVKVFINTFYNNKFNTKNTLLSSIISYYDKNIIWSNGLFDIFLVNFCKSIDKGKPISSIKQESKKINQVQYLSGCSLFFHKDLFKFKKLREEFFLYFEDLQFSLNTKNYVIQKNLVRHKVSKTANIKNAGFSPIQAYWYIRGGIIYYFKHKNISWYEKIVYLFFTTWVIAFLYIRNIQSFVRFMAGLISGLVDVYEKDVLQIKYLFKDKLLIILSKKYLRSVFILLTLKNRQRSKIKISKLKIKIDKSLAKKELVVIYRIAPFNNMKAPIFRNNKFELFKMCLNSFVKTFEKQNVGIIFILDSCPKEYVDIINKIKIKKQLIMVKNFGNLATYYLQLKFAKALKNKFVMFAEDDYFYLPKAGEELMKALRLQKYDFLSPYAHPDHHLLNKKSIGKQDWYKINSTTLTFLGKTSTIRKNFKKFGKYGTYDHPMWLEICEGGYSMASPCPTLSTHLNVGLLAKGVDWHKLWKKVDE